MATMQDLNGLYAQRLPLLQQWQSTAPGTDAYRQARTQLNDLNGQINTTHQSILGAGVSNNGGPGVTQGVGPSTPATTWDQWAQNMQNQYGTAPQGTAASGGIGSQSGGQSAVADPYGANYTGYGNSHIGGPQNNTATQTVPQPSAPAQTPPSRVTQPGIAIPNGGMNGVQQLINGGGQTAVAPTPRAPVPTTSTNTRVTIPTQSAPVPFIIPPPPLPGAITPIAKPRSNNL